MALAQRRWHPTATGTRRGALAGAGLAAFLTAAHLVTDAFIGMFSALLPTIQARFGLGETALALLIATLAFSASVTQPLMGALADRIGRRVAVALGIALSSGLIGLVGLVPTPPLLIGLLLVGGLGSAAFHPAGTSIARAAVARNAGLAVSLFSAGGTLGLAIGPVAILALVASVGLDATPWLLVPGVLLALLAYTVLPDEGRCGPGGCPKLVDARLFIGPVGRLAAVAVLIGVASITFTGALPLWLVAERGVARDDALIGWTLSAFSLAAAGGGLLAGALSARFSRRALVAGSMALAPLPLGAILALEPGTLPFFLAVALAGALVNAGMPLLLVSAQDLAPRAVGAASGMLMGFAGGSAGLLYIAIGRLQEVVGLTAAMGVSFATLLPGAALAYAVLTRSGATAAGGDREAAAPPACACAMVAGALDACSAPAGAPCACAEQSGSRPTARNDRDQRRTPPPSRGVQS
jgi:FSR family fosmidomycin resistance protein-like MFS transporter